MKPIHVALLIAIVLLVAIAMIPLAAADDGGDVDDAEVAPGERMMGAVGASNAELVADVDERAFGLAIAEAAADDDTDAILDLISDRIDRNVEAVDALTDRLDSLQAQREQGELTHGQYQAQVAQLEIQRQSVERTSQMSVQATQGMPVDKLEERGINVTAIEKLQTQASELGGQEVRDIARSIAGPNVGNVSVGPPSLGDRVVIQVERAETPERTVERAANAVDRAEHVLERAQDRAEANPERDVDDLLTSASNELAAAQELLIQAETALAADDPEFRHRAIEASEHASLAIQYANAAMQQLQGPPGAPPPERPGAGQ